jgi:ElaB/YqjD/DUF883 family membrane-anchored ribosome-binding protein
MLAIVIILILAAVLFFALHASHDKRLNKLEQDSADVLHDAASIAGDQVRQLRSEIDIKLSAVKSAQAPQPAPAVIASDAPLTAKNL